MRGSVLVIGGGIAGMVASLDLADIGYKVYLVEKLPSIGGRMAQLDKTMPTLDCSMCIEAPRMVEVARHPNIELLTYAEVKRVKGKLGDFKVEVLKKSRYVSKLKCTGCGDCAQACPVEVPNEYDVNTKSRKAIYVPFPQAVPNTYTIDMKHCIKCFKCVEACGDRMAIDFTMQDEIVELEVGAIVVATGFDMYDPSVLRNYGYGTLENVLTGLEYERLLNAAGPTEGTILRQDGKHPKHIAFIQCVGSRDSKHKKYCSRFCCVYAVKEAILTKEHEPDIKCTIFYMDMRAHGKGQEEFYRRAKDEFGIEFIRSKPACIEQIGDKLQITYEDTSLSEVKTMAVDMVVLANAIVPSVPASLNIEVDADGFISEKLGDPSTTNIPGIYAAGVSQAPRDISDSVAMGSAVAGKVSADLLAARGSEIVKKIVPPERDVTREPLRIGVFLCHCGINIAGVVDMHALEEYSKTLPNVVFVQRNLYTCSEEGNRQIRDAIREHNLNRVVVAACTPRTHEALFRETCMQTGLNPYLLEFASTREMCSWVHMRLPREATEKAKDIVRMAVARAALLEPQKPGVIPVTPKVVVIGGGIAGMQAALGCARNGFQTYLVERNAELGGMLAKLRSMVPTYLDPRQIVREKIAAVKQNPLIKVYTGTEIKNISGFIGNFTVELSNGEKIDAGAIVVATGGKEWKPDVYEYGRNPSVMTQLEFEEALLDSGVKPGERIVMIQCVGSRDEKRPYCSRICCGVAVKNALEVKMRYPENPVYILYNDMRTHAKGAEELYLQAREKGVEFVRFELENKPVVRGNKVTVFDSSMQTEFEISADKIVLSTAIIPNEDASSLAKMLKVPLDANSFFLEAHLKLRPVDFATDGIFVAGVAQSPKEYYDSISQADAVVARIARLLAKPELETEAITSVTLEELCIGCARCVACCPYAAITMVMKNGRYVSSVNQALCKGCGTCVAECPTGALKARHFTTEQIAKMIDAALEGW
jgi:heterodisulfide reductase subunit A